MNIRGFQRKAAHPLVKVTAHITETAGMRRRERPAPTPPTYLIRQKTDFSWVKSLRPEPRPDEKTVSTAPSLPGLRRAQERKAWVQAAQSSRFLGRSSPRMA